MARIELKEPPPPREILAHTTLRVAAGAIVAAEGYVRWLHPAPTRAFVERLMPQASEWLPTLLASGALVVGGCLVVGLLTRLAATTLMIASAASFALTFVDRAVSLQTAGLLALLFACGLAFTVQGAGRLSLDYAQAERARRKAILDDPVWSRPPYAAGESSS